MQTGPEMMKKTTRYNSKNACFEIKYQKLKTGNKSLKELYGRSVELWLMAHELNKDIPEHVTEIFIMAVRAKFMPNNKKKMKDAGILCTQYINHLKKKDIDDDIIEFIDEDYAKQVKRKKTEAWRSAPSKQNSYIEYSKKMKKHGLTISPDAVKKKYERLRSEIKTKDDALKQHNLGPSEE
jgi:hypothetical protein